jgi:dTMP kinase
MEVNMEQGKFIVLEGPDGSGKTTQAKLLKDALEMDGHEVVLTRDPGGTEIGEKLREIVLRGEEVDQYTELLLFTASRNQLVKQVINPAIEAGKIVICDRYITSTIAYQHYGRGWDKQLIYTLANRADGRPEPDLTLYFDLDARDSRERLVSRNIELDNFESDTSSTFQDKVRAGYEDMDRACKEDFASHWVSIKANKPVLEVALNAYNAVVKYFELL